MLKDKILIVSSNYYPLLAKQHLDACLGLLDAANASYPFTYSIEIVEAGTYEIPAVIQYFHRHQPFDGYLPLSLLLKGETDHYEFIWEHIKESFIRFAAEGILMGNGIITAPTMSILESRVADKSRAIEALNALDYLLQLKKRIASH